MAADKDVLKQIMEEMREFEKELRSSYARTEDALTRVQQNVEHLQRDAGVLLRAVESMNQAMDGLSRTVHSLIPTVDSLDRTVGSLSRTVSSLAPAVETLGRTVNSLTATLSGLTQVVSTTKVRHEGFFDKIGHMLNALAEQQAQDRETLADHERRLRLLEQA